jgi:UDP-glucose 4-epimerase
LVPESWIVGAARNAEDQPVRCLVAGGCGFIGHRVSCALRDAGHEVHAVDTLTDYGLYDAQSHLRRLAHRRALMQGIVVHHVDVRDSGGIEALMTGLEPECLVHLGNIPIASVATENPAHASDLIVGGTLTLLEASRRMSVRRFVYVSSSMVYGDFVNEPIDEEHPCAPLEAYGALKLSCERLVRLYSDMHGFEHVIVRPAAVYGPTGNESFVLSRFLSAARNGGVMRVFGSDTRLDFTYVDDVARGILLATTSEKARGETFNIGRGEARYLVEAAQWIAARVTGARISIEPPDSSSPRRGSMGISKARLLLGFEPSYSMEEGLDVFFEHESPSLSTA